MRNPGASVIESGQHLRVYANRTLSPVETILLARYHRAIAGRVLEIGCGAGRILGYLVTLGGEVHGIDLSPRMVEYCRRAYPGASVSVGDMTNLAEAVRGSFDMVFASNNVIDVLNDAERRQALEAMRDLLAPEGVVVFSSHNLSCLRERRRGARRGFSRQVLEWLNRPLSGLARDLINTPRRVRNHRRLRPLETYANEYAIVNDDVHDGSLLLYYSSAVHQVRQLESLGLEVVECLDSDGHRVTGDGAHSFDLHYVARRRQP